MRSRHPRTHEGGMPLFVACDGLAYLSFTLKGGNSKQGNNMELFHWWLIKMVAIQLLCLIGVVWGVRFLWQNRLAVARIQKTTNVAPQNNPPA